MHNELEYREGKDEKNM